VIYSNTWPIFATAMWQRCQAAPDSAADLGSGCLSRVSVYSGAHFRRKSVHGVLRRIDRWTPTPRRNSLCCPIAFARCTNTIATSPLRGLHVIQNWGERSSIVMTEVASRAWRRSKGIPENAFVLGLCRQYRTGGGSGGSSRGVRTGSGPGGSVHADRRFRARLESCRRWPAGSVARGRFFTRVAGGRDVACARER